MRKPNPAITPEDAQKLWKPKPAGGESVITVKCTLVTPMFGGGVEAGKIDRDMPIRASGIRGQLRFWWRLLYGDQDSRATFRDECALWGGISSQGPRASDVTVQVKGGPVSGGQLDRKGHLGIPAYTLILERNDDPELLKPGYAFELALRFKPTMKSAQCQQVLDSLRWWANFAGVGARTRRGLGAVQVNSDTKLQPLATEEVAEKGGWMILGHPQASPVAVWKMAINSLQEFRQGVGVGRNSGSPGRPGRSRWPEPDQIRRMAGSWAPSHVPEHPAEGVYPRAAFGLPIVYHFKDKKDPSDVLNPAIHERMASPLILRPYFDGQGYRPLALLLPGWQQRLGVPVTLNNYGKEPSIAWPEDAVERERLARQVKPMQDYGTDALSAFMHYFEKQQNRGLC